MTKICNVMKLTVSCIAQKAKISITLLYVSFEVS